MAELLPVLPRLVALTIFAATYLVVAIGRLPGFRIDRAGAALLGGSLMVATGVLDLREAYRAIDLDTIALLLGTMIVVAHLKLSGVFALVTARAARHVRGPIATLALVVALSGIASAFLVNDTICLALTPLVLELVGRQGRNPVPYLLAVAMASNIGSTATITGNPQNIMIGSFSQIRYADFAAALAPIALAGLAVAMALLVMSHRRALAGAARTPGPVAVRLYNAPLARKAVLVTALMIGAFFVIHPPAEVALVAGAVLLLTRRIKPERVYREIDWPLLVMFVGLFVVVAGVRKAVLTPEMLAAAAAWPLDHVPTMTLVAAALSNLVSNVPAVLVLKPFVEQAADPRTAWLALAMASTLAGNFTIVGSVANLIVVQRARRHGIEISFWDYFRVGAPLTLVTLAIGAAWLMLTR
ncbi:MAG TPA: anion transporter [Candidatus Sulfotelmatobacter sp.]|nr:anion transporter [Candidatus Sulfotelmatobacter sp.]